MDKDFWTECIAGLTIFVTMAYAPFVNASVLGGAGVPQAPVFYATCLVAALGTILCGWIANTPTALAPGMAFSAFIAQYLGSEGNQGPNGPILDWQEIFLVCFLVSILFFLASFFGFRRKLIEAIPIEIKIAVIGGIGALLSQIGINIAFPNGAASGSDITLFSIGILIIMLLNVILVNYSKKLKSDGKENVSILANLIGRSGILLSVLIVTIIAHNFGTVTRTVATEECLWVWACEPQSGSQALDLFGSHLAPALPFAIFVGYMLLADIAGSPYHLLPQGDKLRDDKIHKSFLVDSGMNLIAPILGTSPAVYYAENSAGQMVGARAGGTAYWIGGCFLALGATGLIFSLYDLQLFEFIPQIAVAPALFTIGLFVIAASLSDQGLPFQDSKSREELKSIQFFMPAAVSIILTPVGLEYGLAAGLLAYYVYFVFAPNVARPPMLKIDPILHFFAIIALFAIIAKIGVLAGSGT